MMENILYGGFEGTDAEICENCESLGELLLKRLREAGPNTVLVRKSKIQKSCSLINIRSIKSKSAFSYYNFI